MCLGSSPRIPKAMPAPAPARAPTPAEYYERAGDASKRRRRRAGFGSASGDDTLLTGGTPGEQRRPTSLLGG